MSRKLDVSTLNGYARNVAGWWMIDRSPFDRDWIEDQMHNLIFKDEFEHVIAAVSENLAGDALKDFTKMVDRLPPREDSVFAKLLWEKLAVDVNGKHIPGKVGTTVVGQRIVGRRLDAYGKVRNDYWNIYAGEEEEREEGNESLDEIPLMQRALNTRISAQSAIDACDAVTVRMDGGIGAGLITGWSGVQPADPDVPATGTKLFTLVCTDPAFPGAVDGDPGGVNTANPITDDPSADATGTLGYCRGSSSNDGATPLDDHIDGEAGTSGADFNFNTLEIVAGAQVSLTSWVVTMPQA